MIYRNQEIDVAESLLTNPQTLFSPPAVLPTRVCFCPGTESRILHRSQPVMPCRGMFVTMCLLQSVTVFCTFPRLLLPGLLKRGSTRSHVLEIVPAFGVTCCFLTRGLRRWVWGDRRGEVFSVRLVSVRYIRRYRRPAWLLTAAVHRWPLTWVRCFLPDFSIVFSPSHTPLGMRALRTSCVQEGRAHTLCALLGQASTYVWG